MNGKFEMYESKGQYRFHLKAGNGEIIATGQGYASKAACEKGIESVKRNTLRRPISTKSRPSHRVHVPGTQAAPLGGPALPG